MTKSSALLFALLRADGTLFQSPIYKLLNDSRRRWYYNEKEKGHKEYHGRKLVGFSKDQMYSVVADVENYRRFVPFCKKSTIIMESSTNLTAELHIGFPPLFESYISDVSLYKPTMVKAVCKDGRLFDYLETCWQFSEGIESNPQTCIVDFSIDFRFKSKLHYRMANLFFDALVRQMEGAFLSEAKRRFGLESIPMHKLSYVKA